MIEVADALGDMLYILCGTILSHGMQYKISEVFEEIQLSNMSWITLMFLINLYAPKVLGIYAC